MNKTKHLTLLFKIKAFNFNFNLEEKPNENETLKSNSRFIFIGNQQLLFKE